MNAVAAVLLAALGSGLGAVLRVWLLGLWPGRPLSMLLLVNASGAALAGLLLALTPQGLWAVFLLAGVLGGYTTVSGLAAQVWGLWTGRGPGPALSWLALTAGLALSLTALARMLAA